MKFSILPSKLPRKPLKALCRRAILSFLIVLPSLSFAQDKAKVSGIVSDISGLRLSGVTISIEGVQQVTTATNKDGVYRITADKNATLVFSMIGYITQKTAVDGKSNIDIKLEPTIANLQEVVVVGYGTQKKISLTSAVATIDKKDLEGRPTPSVVTSLQGQVPGLNVSQSHGQPGFAQTSINIRGISTLSNNPVLVVIDGVATTQSLDDLNANDIESISVLKDASATSIYGARGSGGVLLVTTKTGKNTNGKPTISYDGNLGIQKVTRLPDFVPAPQYVDLVNQAIQNDNPGATPRFDAATIQKYKSGELPSTNWLKLILGEKAYQQQHTLSVSGANDKVSYFLSGALMKQDGLMSNVGYQRKNLRSNIIAKISDKIEIGINSSYVTDRKYQPATYGLGAALGWGYIVPVTEYPYTVSGLPRTFRGGWTPIQSVQGGLQDIKDNTFNNIITAQYHVIPGLDLKGVYSYLYGTVNESTQNKVVTAYYDDGSPAYSAPAAPALTKSNVVVTNPNLILTATYNKAFGKHNLKVLGGYSQEKQSMEYNSLTRGGFLNDQITEIDGGNSDRSLWALSGRGVEWAISSGFGRINYDYDGRYLLEVNGRADGSSRFLNDRVGFFPSVSAGWILSKESFLQNSGTVNFLKMRGSYGSVGNQSALATSGAYADQTNQTTALYPFAALLGTNNYVLNNAQVQTTYYSNIPNADLTWETKTTTNIGLDANLLNSHLSLTLDLYNERTTGIIRTPIVPVSFGAAAPFVNSGIVRNRGYEVVLAYDNKAGQLSYHIGVNFSDNRNKVISLGGTAPTIGNNLLREGNSPNAWFGYQAEGFFQSPQDINNHAQQFNQAKLKPGDIMLKDINGDGLVNASDRIVLGDAQPHYIYGFNGKFNYHNFDLSFVFQGVLKNLSYFGGGIESPFASATGNITKAQLDYWTPQNQNARYPLLRIDQSVNYGALSSWLLYNGAYMRLKNLQIGYTLPKAIADRLKLKGLRLFLTGENLLTITAKSFPKDIDPELGNYGGVGNYPQIRVFSAGLHVGL
jgi:TonB-linked SusC/RagA family outer membrane protein